MYLNRFNSISAVLLYLYFLYSYAKQFAKEPNEKDKFKIYIGLFKANMDLKLKEQLMQRTFVILKPLSKTLFRFL